MWSLMAVTLAAACAFAIASIVMGRFSPILLSLPLHGGGGEILNFNQSR